MKSSVPRVEPHALRSLEDTLIKLLSPATSFTADSHNLSADEAQQHTPLCPTAATVTRFPRQHNVPSDLLNPSLPNIQRLYVQRDVMYHLVLCNTTLSTLGSTARRKPWDTVKLYVDSPFFWQHWFIGSKEFVKYLYGGIYASGCTVNVAARPKPPYDEAFPLCIEMHLPHLKNLSRSNLRQLARQAAGMRQSLLVGPLFTIFRKAAYNGKTTAAKFQMRRNEYVWVKVHFDKVTLVLSEGFNDEQSAIIAHRYIERLATTCSPYDKTSNHTQHADATPHQTRLQSSDSTDISSAQPLPFSWQNFTPPIITFQTTPPPEVTLFAGADYTTAAKTPFVMTEPSSSSRMPPTPDARHLPSGEDKRTERCFMKRLNSSGSQKRKLAGLSDADEEEDVTNSLLLKETEASVFNVGYITFEFSTTNHFKKNDQLMLNLALQVALFRDTLDLHIGQAKIDIRRKFRQMLQLWESTSPPQDILPYD